MKLSIYKNLLLALCAAFVCSCSVSVRHDIQSAKDLSLKTISNKTTSLNLEDGKYTLLHFWSTWCPMCKHELLALQNLERSLDKNTVKIVSVAIDSPHSDVLEIRENYGIKLNLLIDDGDEAKDFFRISDLPQTRLIGKDGKQIKIYEPESKKLVSRTKGPQDWGRPDIIDYYKNLK